METKGDSTGGHKQFLKYSTCYRISHLKSLRKDYATLPFQRPWQLLIHTLVTKQEM